MTIDPWTFMLALIACGLSFWAGAKWGYLNHDYIEESRHKREGGIYLPKDVDPTVPVRSGEVRQ